LLQFEGIWLNFGKMCSTKVTNGTFYKKEKKREKRAKM